MPSDSRARLIAYLSQAGLSTVRANAVVDDYAHELAERIREDVDLDAHPGEAIYPCEDCAAVRAANSIDPAAA